MKLCFLVGEQQGRLVCVTLFILYPSQSTDPLPSQTNNTQT